MESQTNAFDRSRGLSRRHFLNSTAAALACGYAWMHSPAWAKLQHAGQASELNATQPGGIDLYIDRTPLRVDGRLGDAITLNGSIPGPLIRMTQGRQALIRVHNRMSESTSIHWHGLILPFNMDGVPGISFEGIAPGQSFTYRFPVRQNGTYWYHSHTGLQEQHGHYGALILEPAEPDPVAFDLEYPIVLSDWMFDDPHEALRKLKTIEGYYNFQRPTVANLDEQMQMTGQTFSEAIAKRWRWQLMRMDPTDISDITGVVYTYLMNGLSANQNWTAIARPGQKVRLRLINASTMTYFDFRIPGLPMTVVQADGQNIKPVETDELRIAVAETYDVIVTLPDDRAYTLFAETMDRSGFARGTIAPRQGMSADIPPRRMRPMLTMKDMGMMPGMNMDSHGQMDMGSDMSDMKHDAMPHTHGHSGKLATSGLADRIMHGPDQHGPTSITMAMSAFRRFSEPGLGLGNDGRRVLTYSQLKCLNTPRDRRPPTRQFDLHLTGNMHKFIWGFDGKKFSESDIIRFVYGERLRINMINDTMMAHPIHLHGMLFDLYAGEDYDQNPRKHTVNVQPAELLTVDISVDAPGLWAFHCHLLYHMEAGMFRTVAVVKSLEGGPIHAQS